jgi:hypothetical protein
MTMWLLFCWFEWDKLYSYRSTARLSQSQTPRIARPVRNLAPTNVLSYINAPPDHLTGISHIIL